MIHTEQQRLKAVSKFKHLDAGITSDLQEIVSLLAEICQTPVALVTLLDEKLQLFKAAVGTTMQSTSREVAFCNHTIQQEDVLVIPDLCADETHSANPLVTGDPHVRFYAGAPLVTKEGHALGSLCVVDMEARKLTDHQIKSIKVLAKQVVNLMELHLSLNTLADQRKKELAQTRAHQESEIKLKAIFDSTTDTHILVGRDHKVLAFNRSAEMFIHSHYKHKLANGDNILEYTDTTILSQFKKYFSIALSGRSIKREWMLMPGTELECWKVTTFIPVKDNSGEVIGVSLNSNDVTHRKKQEAYINVQNEALHRIAIMQSHELRRPVASLLGIMDLIKMENIYFNYFDMMEITVNELDEKIRGIVKDSEDTLQSGHLSIVA